MNLPFTSSGNGDFTNAVRLLSRHVLAHDTATAALAAWCEERSIGEGPVRTVVLDRALWPKSKPDIGYRRLKLMRGASFLSAAEIRFRCNALSAAMLLALEESDAPFGVVVAALGPRRIATFARIVGDRQAESVLILHATVLDRNGRAIARVREAYQSVLVA